MRVLFWLLGLGAIGGTTVLAYKAGQASARRGTSVSGELAEGPMLTFPVDGVLRVVTPTDRDWAKALSYHLTLAVQARRMGIA